MATFVPGPHGPAHPTVDAVNFPRVRAHTQPLGVQASFSHAYPNGLPVTYKMMPRTNAQGIPETYLEDNLPIGFYTQPPPYAPAIFSTDNGQKPFRSVEHILPRRRIHLWSKDEIQVHCNSTRKTYWNHMKQMKEPFSWTDLWNYYDAQDLYQYGATNLWNVIRTLCDENRIIYSDVARESANHIGQWVDEWLKTPTNENPTNEMKLRNWSEKDGFIVYILSKEDRNNMGDIPDDMIPVVSSALKCRRALLLSNSFHKGRTGPNDVMSAVRNGNFENWQGMSFSDYYSTKLSSLLT